MLLPFMNLLEISLVGLALAVDATLYAFSYGLVLRQQRRRAALQLALTVGLYQMLMPLPGYWGGSAVRELVAAWAPWVVLLVFSTLGGHILMQAQDRGGYGGVCDAGRGGAHQRFRFRIQFAHLVCNRLLNYIPRLGSAEYQTVIAVNRTFDPACPGEWLARTQEDRSNREELSCNNLFAVLHISFCLTLIFIFCSFPSGVRGRSVVVERDGSVVRRGVERGGFLGGCCAPSAAKT